MRKRNNRKRLGKLAMNLIAAAFHCQGDCSIKRRAVKDKLKCAKKQRILDRPAFYAFRSLRGKAGGVKAKGIGFTERRGRS